VTTAPPLIVVAGPTATGKTGLAIELAEALAATDRPVEIISADSRQVFRGLDIGTAKASATDRARVPHHGLDLVDPDVSFSVADFATHVAGVLDDLGRRGGIAVLAGGTGLYLRAIAHGLDADALPSDSELRTRLEADLEEDGLESLVRRLSAIAPAFAATVDLRNPRRVVRALEMAEIQGDRPRPTARGYPGPVAWLGLRIEAPTHQRLIAERARGQFEGGLLDEAQTLRQRFSPSLRAFSAFGYTEAWAVLDGAITREAAIELVVRRTNAFVKRQRTWFRSERQLVWYDATERRPLDQMLAEIHRRIG
jgi:tRNA dimethylallyltransferase